MQTKNYELGKKLAEVKPIPKQNFNELSHLQAENNFRNTVELSLNKSLRAQLSTLKNQKSRLKIEEIDEIQQKTIEEMHTLNEQAMVNNQFYNFIDFNFRLQERFCLP